MTQLQWNYDAGNPVIRPGQLHGDLDRVRTASGQVVRVGDVYRMYCWGTAADGANRVFIAEASVDQPNAWRGLGPVLGAQPDCPYNSLGPVLPCVLPSDDGPWLMYVGTNAPRRGNDAFWWYSAAAESHDGGLTWRYITTEPLIPCDKRYDKVGTGTLFVLRESGTYHMFYTACSEYIDTPAPGTPLVGIAYARSDDGRTWERTLDDLVVRPRVEAHGAPETWVAKPFVVREPRADGTMRYRMWVSAKQHRYAVRSLVSDDLLNWTWEPCDEREGDLGVGNAGAFDDHQRTYAAVIREGDQYRMWYTGNAFGSTGIGTATAPLPAGTAR